MTLVPLHAFAAVEDFREFDFKSLSSITSLATFTDNETNTLQEWESSGDVLAVNDRPFTNSPVTITFDPGYARGGGAVNKSGDVYSLSLRSGGRMTVSVPANYKLLSIQFVEAATGDIYLGTDQPGDYNTVHKQWNAGTAETSQVVITNGPLDASIYKLRVTYTRPSTPLTFTGSNPSEQGTPVASFSTMTVSFDHVISKINEGKSVTIEGPGIEGKQNLTLGPKGATSITLKSSTEITKDGQYTVTIPEGIFENSDGGINSEQIIKFSVYATRTTIKEWIVDPVEGTYTSLPASLTLTFPDDVTVSDTTGVLTIVEAGGDSHEYPIVFSLDETKKIVSLTNSHGIINEEGTCTLSIPEGAIHNSFYKLNAEKDRWNPAFILSYTIERPEMTEVKNARKLLLQSGIGYPTETSAARKSLTTIVNMFDNPETIWNDSLTGVLKDSIAAFYAEKEVTLPTDKQWYKIIGVNAAPDSECIKTYLFFSNDSVGLAKNDGDVNGYKFLAQYDGDKITFMASDSTHYLCVLSDKDYYGANKKNVSKSNGAVNKLVLRKLDVEDADKDFQLGKLAIYGALGMDYDYNPVDSSYATINHNKTIIEATPITKQQFSETVSSAFLFEETTPPENLKNLVEPGVELRPNREIEKAGDELILTIHYVKSAALVNKSKIQLFDKDNKELTIQGDILTKHQDADYEFDINTKGFAAGNYTLVMQKGTFTFVAKDEDKEQGKGVKDMDLTIGFVIKNGSNNPTTPTDPSNPSDPSNPDTPNPSTPTNYQKSYTDYSVLQVILRNEQHVTWLHDTDLNELVIFSDVYSDLVPDPGKTVYIRYLYNDSGIVGYGHFEKYNDFLKDYPEFNRYEYKAIKLVMDQPVREGDLQSSAGTYGYDIPEAAFGDANFGKRLNGDTSIAESDCKVNPQTFNPKFDVNNEKADAATSIKDTLKDTKAQQIYDLTGRRIQSMNKKGIYIVNGRKMVIK